MTNFAARAIVLCILGAPLAGASAQGSTITPVTRVVQLLQALAQQVEKDGKVEEGLYEDFVCWGKSIINQKIMSNAEASSRSDELEQYLADLGAGRVELTSERSDLEKEISELMDDIERMTQVRDKSHGDFLDATDEMQTALDALHDAETVLDKATKDHKEGVLLAVRSGLKGAAENGGMAALAARQAKLQSAVKLGHRFLNKADAIFLERVLLGEVPNRADAKKMNRKANFKMSYKARSFKIQGVLTKMRETFAANLDDSHHKEDKDAKDYHQLKDAKDSQLNAARDALNRMDSENGAKGMSKEQSEDELDALTKQVKNDKDFIEQTRQALREKTASWKTRQELRSGELGAISKAIYILHNDDARDNFKKSFASQEQGFLQVRSTSHKAASHREHKAALVLKDAALRSGDKRLLALASDFATNPDFEKFEPIIKAIHEMLAELQKEETKDLDTKQLCESDRMDNTRTAMKVSRKMDEMTDHIAVDKTTIESCQKKIEQLQTEHDKTQAAYEKASQMRQHEHDEFVVTDRDDEEAMKTVQGAHDVLLTYYKNNGLVFLQNGKQPVDGMSEGEAPPPPPPTWEGGYGAKTSESQGIIAILEMIHEDIHKDSNDAKKDEAKAHEEFKLFEKDSEDQMHGLMHEKGLTNHELGEAERAKITEERQRSAAKDTLDTVLKSIKTINPNCEYYEVNYDIRKRNRAIEVDGLNNAKLILSGGSLPDGPDPNREIKPGDAAAAVFLQSRAAK